MASTAKDPLATVHRTGDMALSIRSCSGDSLVTVANDYIVEIMCCLNIAYGPHTDQIHDYVLVLEYKHHLQPLYLCS